MSFSPRGPHGPPPPLPHGASPRYYGWLMTFYPQQMVEYEMGYGGPDPRHVLRRSYENHIRRWGSNGPAGVRIMTDILLDRAEVLMGARTEQGPDENSYWVGAPGRHDRHRILAPHRHHEYQQTQHSYNERQEIRDTHIVRDSWWERDLPCEHVMWRGHTTHEIFGRGGGPHDGGFTHHGYHAGHGHGAGHGYGGHGYGGHGYGRYHQQGMNRPHDIENQHGPYRDRNCPRHTAGSRFHGGFLHGREQDLAGPYGGHHASYFAEEHFGGNSDGEYE